MVGDNIFHSLGHTMAAKKIDAKTKNCQDRKAKTFFLEDIEEKCKQI
jgi:hypothetical protein